MKIKTYVIRDIDGRCYRSFCNNFFTTALGDILVIHTDDFHKAKKFHSLMWASHRAKFLSIKSFGYYYVYETADKDADQKLILKNEQIIERIRKNDSEITEEIEKMIAERKIHHEIN